MRTSKSFNKRRLVAAFVGGALLHLMYKFYLYTYDREQFEDSNLLVAAVSVLIAAALIYLLSWLVSTLTAPKK